MGAGTLKRIALRVLGGAARRWFGTSGALDPSLWDLTRDGGGMLTLHGLGLADLGRRFGTPLYVVDGVRLARNAQAFLAVPPGASRGCEVYYSYKTNPVPDVLRRLHALGVGAEVISAYEYWLARRLGVPPERIVYNGPVKGEDSLRQAIAEGIGLLNFNSRGEIAQVAALARAAGRTVRAGIRVAVDVSWGGQFGESASTGAALRAFEEALATPGLQVVGLHAHRAGELASLAEVEQFVGQVLAFEGQLARRLGVELEVVDLGGNLACPTTSHPGRAAVRANSAFGTDLVPRDPASVPRIGAYVQRVTELVAAHFRAAGRERPRIFLEPGRAMTADAQLLLTSVHRVRDAPGAPDHAILDGGFNIAAPVPDNYHQVFAVRAPAGAPSRPYRLVGPVCTHADTLCRNVRLPELAPGDLLAIMDAGAYFVPFSTSFSFPRPAIVVVDPDGARLVRRAETFQDLVARDEGL